MPLHDNLSRALLEQLSQGAELDDDTQTVFDALAGHIVLEPHIWRTMLSYLIEVHGGRAMLAFSGGLGSLAALDLLRDERERVTVAWVNTGAAFPGHADFVRRASEGFEFVELACSQEQYFKKWGVPSDAVTTGGHVAALAAATGMSFMARNNPDLTRTCPASMCCYQLRMEPLLEATYEQDINLIISGSRRHGPMPVPVLPGPYRDKTISFAHPIRSWTTAGIRKHLDQEGVELPPHCREPFNLPGGICANCSAHRRFALECYQDQADPSAAQTIRQLRRLADERVENAISGALDIEK